MFFRKRQKIEPARDIEQSVEPERHEEQSAEPTPAIRRWGWHRPFNLNGTSVESDRGFVEVVVSRLFDIPSDQWVVDPPQAEALLRDFKTLLARPRAEWLKSASIDIYLAWHISLSTVTESGLRIKMERTRDLVRGYYGLFPTSLYVNDELIAGWCDSDFDGIIGRRGYYGIEVIFHKIIISKLESLIDGPEGQRFLAAQRASEQEKLQQQKDREQRQADILKKL